MAPLEALGFALAGYGCTTCIGNSGPLDASVAQAVEDERPRRRRGPLGQPQLRGPDPPAGAGELPRLAAARRRVRPRRPGRHRPAPRAARHRLRRPRRLPRRPLAGARRDQAVIGDSIDPELFRRTYAVVFEGDDRWRALPIPSGDRYAWDPASTYIAKPPFFEGLAAEAPPVTDIEGARVLAVLGDSVTTDHISPAGSISPSSPAGQWLQEHGVGAARVQLVRRPSRPPRGDDAGHVRQHPAAQPARRGQGRARTRSTCPDGEELFIYDAAMRYRAEGVPLVVIAGREYGSGSSRDWAAKGTALLGVRAVIAESYERIHRSNLVGMGVLPLQFLPGDSAASLGLTGREAYTIRGLAEGLAPRQRLTVETRGERRRRSGGSRRSPASTDRSTSAITSRGASCRRSCGDSRRRGPDAAVDAAGRAPPDRIGDRARAAARTTVALRPAALGRSPGGRRRSPSSAPTRPSGS